MDTKDDEAHESSQEYNVLHEDERLPFAAKIRIADERLAAEKVEADAASEALAASETMRADEEDQRRRAAELETQVLAKLKGEEAKRADCEVLRSYQTTCLDAAIKCNTICLLPTGMGKTLIAVHFIRYHMQRDSMKRFALMAPTKIIVEQHCRYISDRIEAGIIAQTFTGESFIQSSEGKHVIDNWDANDWLSQMKDCNIMCFTPGALMCALQRSTLHSSMFDVIIFDECHHAIGKHPMNIVCQIIKEQQYGNRILGLTATLLKDQHGAVDKKIEAFKDNFCCQVINPTGEINSYLENKLREEGSFEQQLLLLRHESDSAITEHAIFKRLNCIYQKTRQCCYLHYLHALQKKLRMDDEMFYRKFVQNVEGKYPLPRIDSSNYVPCNFLSKTQTSLGQLILVIQDNGIAAGLLAMAHSHREQNPVNPLYLGIKPTSRAHNDNKVDENQIRLILEDLTSHPINLNSLTNGRDICAQSLLETLALCCKAVEPSIRQDAHTAFCLQHDKLCQVGGIIAGCMRDAVYTSLTELELKSLDFSMLNRYLTAAYGTIFSAVPDELLINSIFALPLHPPTIEPLLSTAPLRMNPLVPLETIDLYKQCSTPAATSMSSFPLISVKLQSFFSMWFITSNALSKNSKSIVFVQTKLSVVSLGFLFNRVVKSQHFLAAFSSSDCPVASAELLVGTSMETKDQDRAIQQFGREGEGSSNILFATDVAEEGLDITKCMLVVHYDTPTTTKSLIQRHGRARASNPLAIFLVPRGEEGEEMVNGIHDLLHRNKEVNICTASESHAGLSSTTLSNPRIFSRTPHISSSTSKLIEACAIDILSNFCALLPHDDYFSPQPIRYTELLSPAASTKAPRFPRGGLTTCHICKIEMSTNNFDAHMNGSAHAKNVSKAMLADQGGSISPRFPRGGLTTCHICKIEMSTNNFDAHMNGSAHAKNVSKAMLADQGGSISPRFPRGRLTTCHICKIEMSTNNFDAHMNGRSHIRNAALLDHRILPPSPSPLGPALSIPKSPMPSQYICSILLPSSVPPAIRCAVGKPSSCKMAAEKSAAMACLFNLQAHGELDENFRVRDLGLTQESRKSKRRALMAAALATERAERETQRLEARVTVDLDAIADDENTALANSQLPLADNSIESPAARLPKQTVELLKVVSRYQLYSQPSPSPHSPTRLYFYSMHPKGLDPTALTSDAARFLLAIQSVGIAYSQPLPQLVLDTPFTLTLSGVEFSIIARLIEEKCIAQKELCQLQSFHMALHCWTATHAAQEGSSVPISPQQWTSFAAGHYYILFPAPPSNSLTDSFWSTFLPQCVREARSLVVNLSRYRDDNQVSETWRENYTAHDLSHLGSPSAHSLSLAAGTLVARGSFDLWVTLSPASVSATKLNECQSDLSDPTITARFMSSKLSLVLMMTSLRQKQQQLRERREKGESKPVHEIGCSEPEGKRSLELAVACCRVMGNVSWLEFGLVAPSLVWRLNSLCSALETHEHLMSIVATSQTISPPAHNTHDKIAPPSLLLLLEAITLRGCGEELNLERLEAMGDSVLKFVVSSELFSLFPDKNEGALTKLREDYISNVCLIDAARELQLVQFIRALPLAVGRTLMKHPSGMPSPSDRSASCLWGQKLTVSKTLMANSASVSEGGDGGSSARPSSVRKIMCSAYDQQDPFIQVSVKEKALADMMESLIGAYFTSHGLSYTLTLMRALNLLPDKPISNPLTEPHIEKSAASLPAELIITPVETPEVTIPSNYATNLRRLALAEALAGHDNIEPASFFDGDVHGGFGSSATTRRSAKDPKSLQIESIAKLECLLGYTFKSKELLVLALTHCSVMNKPSNQRLEWLGDAVLDLVVMEHLYASQKAADEGELSGQKSDATNNKSLARHAVRLQLHRHLTHSSQLLREHFECIDASCIEDSHLDTALEAPGCTKILADTFEAVIGAVHLDSHAEAGLAAVRDLVIRIGVVDSNS